MSPHETTPREGRSLPAPAPGAPAPPAAVARRLPSWVRALTLHADDPAWLDAAGRDTGDGDLAPRWATATLKIEPRHAVFRMATPPAGPGGLLKVELPTALRGREWLFGPTWGAVEFAHARRLHRAGVATPRPLALAVFRRRGVVKETDLVLEWVDGVPLDGWLAAGKALAADLLAASRAVGALVRSAHRAGFVHGHLSTKNILLAGGNPRTPLLIDLNKGAFQRGSIWCDAAALVDLRWLVLCRTRHLVRRAITGAFLRGYLDGADRGARRAFYRLARSGLAALAARIRYHATFKLAQRAAVPEILADVPAFRRGISRRGETWSDWIPGTAPGRSW